MRQLLNVLSITALSLLLVGGAGAAQGSDAASPFCVMISGVHGQGSLPEICSFDSYAACLQAAARMNGNCVANVDYRGPVDRMTGAAAPAPSR